jgi:hypothetical protein
VVRFVLRYRGKGEYPAATIQRIRAIGGSIIEDTGRMLLVEAPERELREALESERDWLLTPETAYALPDPREAIK